jgi:hypothetical protein
VAALFFPFWRLRLNAPQYPQGLFMTVYIDHIQGDIREIDGLNHYIGMRPLGGAARMERSVSIAVVGVFVASVLALAFSRRRWLRLLALGAILFPFVFLLDLYLWLRWFGNNLDPTAALSGAVPPFTPRILGHGAIAQFSTDAAVAPGFWFAMTAAVLILAGVIVQMRENRKLNSPT